MNVDIFNINYSYLKSIQVKLLLFCIFHIIIYWNHNFIDKDKLLWAYDSSLWSNFTFFTRVYLNLRVWQPCPSPHGEFKLKTLIYDNSTLKSPNICVTNLKFKEIVYF